MIFPSKLESFQDTTLKKSIYILKSIPENGIKVLDLYATIKRKFSNILEYQYALDLLFCVDKIILKGETICLRK